MKYTPQNKLIIIPAKDEAIIIETVIKEVKRNGWHNILVVNDQCRFDRRRGGGKMAEVCDILLAVPSKSTPRIQEMHI